MKSKCIFFMLVLFTIVSCEHTGDSAVRKGYVPTVSKFTSDIMTPEILWSFGVVGNVAVSPDGSSVVYSVTYNDIEENRPYRDIYLVSVRDKVVSRLTNTQENESGIQWRPDGERIGYLSSASGTTQVWEIKPNGTAKRQVSDIPGGISGFKYSPDMKHILYVKSVKLDDSVHDLFPDLPKANARLENDLMYRHWDRWHDYKYSHIFVAKYGADRITGGKDIMEGERYNSPMKPFGGVSQISWSADGKKIAYPCKKKTGVEYAISTNSDIYIYDIDTGSTRNFTEGMMGYDNSPVFSPDNRKIAWESMERDGYEADKTRLFVADLASGKRTDYTLGFDQNASNITWSADGSTIYFISNIHATYEIYSLDIRSGSIKRLTDGIHNYRSVMIAGDRLVAQKESMSSPAELYSVDPVTGKDSPITTVNKEMLDKLTMGRVEKRWVKTTDNKDMLVWVIYPPNFDSNKRYPALLYCQGGPQSAVSQSWSYRWNFQMMAANDYIVVAPNRRGLPGFGQEWNEQISGDYGGQNIRDYLSAIDALSAEPFVDEKRLGAVGASYGGFSTFYLAGVHKDRFSAFISHCGIFNQESMYATTEEKWFVDFDLKGAYWDLDNAAAMNTYKKFSPHRHVQNWDTPILVIHGAKDFRVPETQGMAAFNAAQLRGVPSQFLYFPEENHWVLSAQNGILWQRVFFNWLDKWLK